MTTTQRSFRLDDQTHVRLFTLADRNRLTMTELLEALIWSREAKATAEERGAAKKKKKQRNAA